VILLLDTKVGLLRSSTLAHSLASGGAGERGGHWPGWAVARCLGHSDLQVGVYKEAGLRRHAGARSRID